MPASHPSQFRSDFPVTVAPTLLASMTLYRPECANSRRACLLTSSMVAVLLVVFPNSDAAGLTSSSSKSNTAILTGGDLTAPCGKTGEKAKLNATTPLGPIFLTAAAKCIGVLPKVARRGARKCITQALVRESVPHPRRIDERQSHLRRGLAPIVTSSRHLRSGTGSGPDASLRSKGCCRRCPGPRELPYRRRYDGPEGTGPEYTKETHDASDTGRYRSESDPPGSGGSRR